MYTHTHIYIYMYTHTHIYIYIYTQYIYIYVHTHVPPVSLSVPEDGKPTDARPSMATDWGCLQLCRNADAAKR